MRMVTKCFVLLIALAGAGANVPARAEVLYYICGQSCMAAPCESNAQFRDILAGTQQQRIVFPSAGAGSLISNVIARPDKVRTQSRVTPQEVSFEFWTNDGRGHGHMTIRRSDGHFAFSMIGDGQTWDRMSGNCRLQAPLQRDVFHLSRPGVPDLN